MSKSPKFGGMYNHAVIKELRSEVAKKGIILSALVEHCKIDEQELNRIVIDYMMKMESRVRSGNE